MASLEELSLSQNQLRELPTSLGKLSNLRKLYVFSNKLERLPDSFAELRALEVLYLEENQLTALPPWVAELPALASLDADDNPLQMPPSSVLDAGVGAVRRYIRDLQRSGASVSRKVKLVLVGCGLAGKTSTLRGLQHGAPRPTDVDARTVQLDIWPLLLGAEPEPQATDERVLALSLIHISEPTRPYMSSYAVFCLNK